MEPWCRFVFTKDELNSSKIQKYIKTHKYYSTRTLVSKFELKKWTIDDIISLKEGDGWTPQYNFDENGLTFEFEIDLHELFDGIKLQSRIKNGKVSYFRKAFGPNWKHNLLEKKSEIQKSLNSIDFENRELVIYRTSRRGLNNWDVIEVFSIGRYHTMKDQIRKQLIQRYQKELEKQKQTIRETKKLNKNAPKINWNKMIESLKKEAEKKPGEYFLIDPDTLTTYNINSKDDRKKLYCDFSKNKDGDTL